jgi:hypothetical protein
MPAEGFGRPKGAKCQSIPKFEADARTQAIPSCTDPSSSSPGSDSPSGAYRLDVNSRVSRSAPADLPRNNSWWRREPSLCDSPSVHRPSLPGCGPEISGQRSDDHARFTLQMDETAQNSMWKGHML